MTAVPVSEPKLTFAEEPYQQILEELKPLLPRHHEELATWKDIPLAPNFPFYDFVSRGNVMHFWTARLDGELIAYANYMIQPHPHYSTTLWAMCDIVLVVPEHRSYGVGNGLFDLIERECEKLGAHVIVTATKAKHPALKALLQSRGHDVTEIVLSKRTKVPV